MRTISTLVASIEVYSVDECWCDLTGMPGDLEQLGRDIQARVRQWVNIPVGVGIGPTKTLAKLAQWAGKNWPATGGVVNLMDSQRQQKLLKLAPVGEVWGVGRKLSSQLETLGIKTAFDLASADPRHIGRMFSKVLERTARELRGEQWLKMHDDPDPKKEIVSSKMFGRRVYLLEELRQAVAAYTTRAAEKLREQDSVCSELVVSVQTSPFADPAERYWNGARMLLPTPTADTRDLIQAANQGLHGIYRDGFAYSKCTIQLCRLSQLEGLTHDMFAPQGDVSRNPRNFRHPSWVGSTLVSPATFWRIELGHPSLDGHRSTMFNGSLTGPSFCGGYSIHKSSRFLKFQSVGSSGPVILSLQLVAARSMVCIGIGSLERSEKNTRTLGVSSDSIPGSTTTARR
ncbi:Y-family DNA polymerase [Pseudomonas aeruginosa]|nr:Y-family DNA polymerase [Pseudomonas aeruginosa]